jgi:hypothetical protein
MNDPKRVADMATRRTGRGTLASNSVQWTHVPIHDSSAIIDMTNAFINEEKCCNDNHSSSRRAQALEIQVKTIPCWSAMRHGACLVSSTCIES